MDIDIAMLATPFGAWMITSGILIGLKERLGDWWTDKANKVASVLLPVVLVEAGIAATGATEWYVYLIGILTGLTAYQAAEKTQTSYNDRLLAKK